jgi:hypothetical protein
MSSCSWHQWSARLSGLTAGAPVAAADRTHFVGRTELCKARRHANSKADYPIVIQTALRECAYARP